MYKALTIMVFILLNLTAQAQEWYQKDSLRVALNKVLTNKSRLHTLIKLADSYAIDMYSTSNIDSADFYLEQARKLNKEQYGAYFKNAINLISAEISSTRNPERDFTPLFLQILADCRKSGDKLNELDAWDELGYHTRNEKSDSFRLNCYQHALSLCVELNDPRELYYARQIADIHLQQHKLDLAENELLQILKNHKKGRPGDILRANDLLTAVYTAKVQYDKALFCGIRTVKLMQMTKDSITAITFYSRLISIEMFLGNKSLALYWAKKTLYNAIVTNKPAFIYSCCNTIVNCLLSENEAQQALRFILDIRAKYKPLNNNDKITLYKILGNCYYALKRNDLAEKSYLEMVTVQSTKAFNFQRPSQADAFGTIASFYIKIGQYKKARTYLLGALKYYDAVGQVPNLLSVNLSLFKVDSALGNYRLAIAHLQEGNKLKDSMFNIAKNKQIEELNISYQTDEREKDLKLVQNKERLEQVKLQHTETTRNWIIAGSGLLLIIAGLLFRQSRLRRKNNKLITHKNKVITHKNELLQSLVTEKEWLLKEVHHRVKNNLHTVICLLESQAAYLEDDALKAIEKSQHRIYTMSLIHQKLYQSDDVKTIDMSVYIPELVQYLEDSFDVSSQIHFNLMIGSIQLSPSQAIPLALLINEAVTNAIKYAFPDSKKGEITISLTDTGAHYKLEITDNGIGMSEKEKREANSLGLDLMKGLSKEIMGNINIENKDGIKITVLFEYDILDNIDASDVDYFTSERGEINL